MSTLGFLFLFWRSCFSRSFLTDISRSRHSISRLWKGCALPIPLAVLDIQITLWEITILHHLWRAKRISHLPPTTTEFDQTLLAYIRTKPITFTDGQSTVETDNPVRLIQTTRALYWMLPTRPLSRNVNRSFPGQATIWTNFILQHPIQQ